VRAGCGRAASILLLCACAVAPDAHGSFELLPGPAPGARGGWAWDSSSPAREVREDRGPRARLAIGAPAVVAGLGWSYARACVSVGGGWRLEGDGYVLCMEDVYRELTCGAWVGRRAWMVGVRRWNAAWMDDTRRGGWTFSARARTRVHSLDLVLAAQDLAVGVRDPAAPAFAVGAGASYRASHVLEIGAAYHRDASSADSVMRLSWAPIPEIAFEQEFRLPRNEMQTGIEFRAGRATVGLWCEPSIALGPRIGMTCAFN